MSGRFTPSRLPWLEVAIEAAVGNGLGAGVYRRWVAGLGLARTESVLEIGTGGGACARHLAAALPAGRLVCVDSDPRWGAIASERLADFGARVEFVVADASTWSRPGAFDSAVAHFVLHDMTAAQRSQTLRRLSESLRPGGRLHVREPVTHGMTAEELLGQLGEAGFRELTAPTQGSVPLMGETMQGVWTK